MRIGTEAPSSPSPVHESSFSGPADPLIIEIRGLVEEVSASDQTDEVTKSLQHFLPQFLGKIEACGEFQEGLELVLDFLEGCFIEEFRQLPIINPCLGSDGHLYCRDLLQVFYAHTEIEGILDCSPITGKSDFFVMRHKAMEMCKSFLNDHGRVIENPPIKKELDRLGGAALPLPDGRNTVGIHQLWNSRKVIFKSKRALALAEFQRDVASAQRENQEVKLLRERIALLSEEERVQNQVYGHRAVQEAISDLAMLKAACDFLEGRVVQLEEAMPRFEAMVERIIAQNLGLEHQNQEMIAECGELVGVLHNVKKAVAKAVLLKKIAFVAQVAMFVYTAGTASSFFEALIRKGLQTMIETLVSVIVKDQKAAAFVSATINGGAFSPDGFMKGAFKGAALATLENGLSESKINPVVQGLVMGGAGDGLSGANHLPENMILNGALRGLSHDLPVTFSGSVVDTKEGTQVNFGMRVKEVHLPELEERPLVGHRSPATKSAEMLAAT